MLEKNKAPVRESLLENQKNIPDRLHEIGNSGMGRFLPNGKEGDYKRPLVLNWKNKQKDQTDQNTRPRPDLPEGYVINTMTHEQAIQYKGVLSVGFILQGHLYPDCFDVDRTEVACADFDDVLDPDTGKWLYPLAKEILEQMFVMYPNLYVEVSLSRKGLHVFFVPTKSRFLEAMSGGLIYFTQERGKNAPKIELFWLGQGRQIILTGNKYEDSDDFTICSGDDLAEGESADQIMQYLIDNGNAIAKTNIPATIDITENSTISSNISSLNDLDTNGSTAGSQEIFEYERAKAIELLALIICSLVDRDTWFHITTVLKKYGLHDEWVAWCATDPDRFISSTAQKENQDVWNSIDEQNNYSLGVLVNEAKKQHGISIDTDDEEAREAWRQIFNEKAFREQWELSHPEYNNHVVSENITDEQELALIEKEINAFYNQSKTFIETIKNLQSFEQDAVFTPEVIKAAACAKLFNPQAFTSFKIGVQNYCKANKVTYWSMLNSKITDQVHELESSRNSLERQRKLVQAKIKSQAFATTATDMENFVIPEGYSVTAEGVFRLGDDNHFSICRYPVFVRQQIHDVERDTYKIVVSYMNKRGIWQNLPAMPFKDISNARSIIDLADYKFPVTSTNAYLLSEYVSNFFFDNENTIPLIDAIKRGGWQTFNGTAYFIDPRIDCSYNDGTEHKITLEDTTFTRALVSYGSIDEWNRAYDLAKTSLIARTVIAASISSPLLEVLNHRNFVVYVYGRTLSGKSTALLLGASAVGNPDALVRTFDATKNALAGLAVTMSHYSLLIDEKQASDNKLNDNLQGLVYSIGGGKGRARMSKDATIKLPEDFRTVMVANGETPLLDDNVTGGANTRCLQLQVTQPLFPAETLSRTTMA